MPSVYPVLVAGVVLLLATAAVACEQAEFEVVSLDITPQEVAPGEEVTITASNPCQIG